MICKSCGNTCSDDSKFCPKCGKRVIKHSSISLKAKIFIFGSLILSVLILILTIVFVLVDSFFSDSIEKKNDLEASEFIQYMENRGCKVVDMLEINPDTNFSFYYITDDESCPYRSSYMGIKEDSFLIYDEFLDRVSENTHVTYTSRVNSMDYYESSTSGDEYRIAILSGNHLFYLEADREYKSDAVMIKQELGYTYEPNFESLSYAYSSILIILILLFASWWKLNIKFGRKGWVCLIPFYNLLCLSKDVFGKMWYTIFFFIPLANTIYMAFLLYNLGKVFGKGETYRVLMIFLSFVLVPFVAFDDSKYLGPIK